MATAGASPALPAFAQSEKRIVLGLQVNRGAKIYFDAFNAAGGANGHAIELRALGDGYEPERCKANTAKRVKDNVFALFGYGGTPTCLAALPVVNDAKIPLFGPFTGAESLRTPFNRLLFHVCASHHDETALIVKQLTALGLKKIAVFHQNDAYGKAGLEGVQLALQPRNLVPVATGTVERNSVDVAAAVKAIVAAKPEAVVQSAPTSRAPRSSAKHTRRVTAARSAEVARKPAV